ncbi:hypothetical protein QR680_015054 [Steinernema hermaphroditum]|uniref:DNA endonuclease activator Ctp1 C-terminal domain-containing protein n=1 Tax=Steinernema hermaphroditum TaxID=289476 RepID=A0AA39IB03_9BILA|nr:hypothetical protein QR680_015054 [Steinernema hermaphroditum]
MPGSDDDLFADTAGPWKSARRKAKNATLTRWLVKIPKKKTVSQPVEKKETDLFSSVLLGTHNGASDAKITCSAPIATTPSREVDLFSPRSTRSDDMFPESDLKKSPRLFTSPATAPLTPSQKLNRRPSKCRRSLFDSLTKQPLSPIDEQLDDTVPINESYGVSCDLSARRGHFNHTEDTQERENALAILSTPPETQKVMKTPDRCRPSTSNKGLSPYSRAMLKARRSTEFGHHRSKNDSNSGGIDSGQILKTPERCRPSTSKANVILSPASRAIMEKFSSHSAARNQEHKGVAVYKKTLPERDEGVVRKRADRALLHGFDCRCCATYYDALKLSPESRKRRIDEVSRHRGVQELPPTPPRYWDLQMPSTQTQQHLGWIETSDSPLAKKPRGKTARKLFVQ